MFDKLLHHKLLTEMSHETFHAADADGPSQMNGAS
jgi:hypothetical protein